MIISLRVQIIKKKKNYVTYIEIKHNLQKILSDYGASKYISYYETVKYLHKHGYKRSLVAKIEVVGFIVLAFKFPFPSLVLKLLLCLNPYFKKLKNIYKHNEIVEEFEIM